MSSIGKSGARSWGPIGWPVPGWSGGGSGVLKSAWTLYHFVGMSFSPRRNLVLSPALVAMRGLLADLELRAPGNRALPLRKGALPGPPRACYTRLARANAVADPVRGA